MKINSRRDTNVTILDLDGKLVLGEGTAKLREEIRDLIANGQKLILLNLKKVLYIDSSGLGELVSSFAAVERQGGDLKLVNLAKGVHGLLQMTKLHTVFEIYENEAEAARSFRK